MNENGINENESQPVQSTEQITCGTIIDDFEILERIGSGAFSNVHIARHIPTNFYCAAKIITISTMCEEEFNGMMREVSIFMQVDHPYICNLYRLIQQDPYLIFFIEFATRGTMLDFVNSKSCLNEFEAQHYFVQIFAAVRHLHIYHFCVHRDLKLENILLDAKGNVKLADFGLSSTYYNNRMKTFVGTPGYQPPEILGGNEYDEKCDVWSLGVCLYAMLTASLPFSTANCSHRMLVEEVAQFKFPPNFSPSLVDLFKKMFEVRVSYRPSLIQLQSHPWLRGLPQLGANIAPTPVIFYNVSSLAQISKFKRRKFKPDDEVLRKCEEMGLKIEDLKHNLMNGITDNETATYFMLLRPLKDKPPIPQPKNVPPIIPNKRKTTGKSPNISSNLASTLQSPGIGANCGANCGGGGATCGMPKKAISSSSLKKATEGNATRRASVPKTQKGPVVVQPQTNNYNPARCSTSGRTNVFTQSLHFSRKSSSLQPLRPL